MKRSELEASRRGGGGCREHPNNKQQPGVCASCLREKLSKLYDNKVNKTTYYSPPLSTTSPQPFSSSSLNYVSPAYRRLLRRHTSHVTDSVPSMISFNYGSEKSKSIAFASRNRPREREVNRDNRGRKKDSFWSKLLKLTTKDKKKKT